jgi:hypothetical protein
MEKVSLDIAQDTKPFHSPKTSNARNLGFRCYYRRGTTSPDSGIDTAVAPLAETAASSITRRTMPSNLRIRPIARHGSHGMSTSFHFGPRRACGIWQTSANRMDPGLLRLAHCILILPMAELSQ